MAERRWLEAGSQPRWKTRQADMNHTQEDMAPVPVPVPAAQEVESHSPLGPQEPCHKAVGGNVAIDMLGDRNQLSSGEQAGSEDKSSGTEGLAVDMKAQQAVDTKVFRGLEMKMKEEEAAAGEEGQAHIW
ncbi:hypothetical protein Trco_001737 [Trichoderma cornu-damae]|uniref:Uncharacterized protein n=1 Tax=Trichoderma cornu-damae TaxID=654480 RepID=A0A9P8TUE1_9HYPO|nr:hypothetical protein Trco_001737 [Trichoderma cornu-damae]